MEPTSKFKSKDATSALSSVLDLAGLTSEQKAKTLDNLSRAIYLNMLSLLSSKLSDDQKEELEKKQPQGQKEIAETLSNFFTKDDIHKSFESASSDIIGRFLDQI